MKRAISPFKLGLFVLLGLSIGLGAIIWMGVADVFKKQVTYATFFDHSVAGLQSGASVRYLGVDVGQVKSIGLAPGNGFVRVLVALRGDFPVEESMYLQMSQVGITGQAFLSLRKAPEGEVLEPPPLSFEPDFPVIPNRPSEMDQLLETAKSLVENLKGRDLASVGELISEWRQAGSELSDLLASSELKTTLENLNAASADLQNILQALGGAGGPAEWRDTFADLAMTAERLRSASQDLSSQLDKVPEGALADVASQLESMASSGEKAVKTWDRQAGQTFDLLERNMQQITRLVADLDRLVRSLRREPGQILERREGREPFGR